MTQHFNPRSLHGERPPYVPGSAGTWRISIHAPCTGSDRRASSAARRSFNFNPRSLHGERQYPVLLPPPFPYFNPRSLHGERRRRYRNASSTLRFQSTLPARGATRSARKPIRISCDFNPRSLTGSDACSDTRSHLQNTFQSTLPARGATFLVAAVFADVVISIHAPCTGSDMKRVCLNAERWEISIHAPCTGSDN